MNKRKYKLSFSTGGLFQNESVELGALYLQLRNWKKHREKVFSENLLQERAKSSLKRVYAEMCLRLKCLSDEEIEFLVDTNEQEQRNILWIAVCRCYQFIGEFATEVLRENYISLKMNIYLEDFNSYFNRKAEWHPELDNLKESTRQKLRQVLFKILHEANLLTGENIINPPIFSRRFMDLISRKSCSDFYFFPIFDSDLKEMSK